MTTATTGRMEDRLTRWRRLVERQLSGHAAAARHADLLGDGNLLVSWAEWLLKRAVLIFLENGPGGGFSQSCSEALRKWDEGLERSRQYDATAASLFIAVALGLQDKASLRFAASAPEWLAVGAPEWKHFRTALLAIVRSDAAGFASSAEELEGLLSVPANAPERENLAGALALLRAIQKADPALVATLRKQRAAEWEANRQRADAVLEHQFDFLDWGISKLATGSVK